MRIRLLGKVALALGGYAAGRSAKTPPPAPATSPVAGWAEFTEALRTLPERMLAKLPEVQRSDPQLQQEVARLALESLASCTLDAIGGDGDAPQFLPTIGQLLNIGQPNADTIYRSCTITPGGSYRITGTRGSLRLVVMTQVVPGSNDRPHLDFATLKLDKAGRYSVLLSPEKPAGYKGDWWPLAPRTAKLMIRFVSSDWAGEVSPTIAIERVDQPIASHRPSAAVLEKRLRALPAIVDRMALLFVDHAEQLRAEGFVNRFKIFDVPEGALAGQFYYEGVYELAEDEALIVDSPIPARCDYRSLILTNEIYETTDWINNQASLNGDQADPDGRLRIVISAKDPGIANWLDTSGYPSGVVQGRWTGCDSQPIPEVTKVKLADLRKLLPRDAARVTPRQRQAILSARRTAWQHRPQW
jgi:hypothetical protein